MNPTPTLCHLSTCGRAVVSQWTPEEGERGPFHADDLSSQCPACPACGERPIWESGLFHCDPCGLGIESWEARGQQAPDTYPSTPES